MDIRKFNMTNFINNEIKTILKKIIKCPFCDGELIWDTSLNCLECSEEYPINKNNGQLDLRLKRPKPILYRQTINSNSNSFNTKDNKKGVYGFKFGYEKKSNGFDFKNIDGTNKKPIEKLYSWLPKNKKIAMDIGSAKDIKNKKYLQSAGYIYISVDYDSPIAMILADAHALPFHENTFDCITNLAVMEHIEFPFIAGQEFFRTLNIGGRMLGIVAFLQQQHMSSWYHFTHYGVYSWLVNSGFNEKNIKIDAASKIYHGIFNTASLIGLPNWLKNFIIYPIYVLHRLLWKIFILKTGKNVEKTRHLQTTGAIHFIADK